MSNPQEFLLVGGLADGRRVKLRGPDERVTVCELRRPFDDMARIDDPSEKISTIKTEHYARMAFTGDRGHRLHVYAAPFMTPADVLERLVERYPEELSKFGQNPKAWRAFAEVLPFVESGRLLWELRKGFEFTYGPMPSELHEKCDAAAEMIGRKERGRL